MSELYNINQLKKICRQYRLTPSKKYGQNFLINSKPVEKMVEAARLGKTDTVVEVGPGLGALTLALAEKAKKVVAFEIEKKLQPYWEDRLQAHKNVEVVWGDAINQLRIKNYELRDTYKVIANLPYQITSKVIRGFLEAKQPPQQMVLMVQKEVAERICARPGQMSVLAVAVQYYSRPEIVLKVPKTYFWPQPQVDSAVISLEVKKSTANQAETDKFFQVVKLGFANRRKLLLSKLSSLGKRPDLLAIFKKIGLSEKARAQELSVAQWRQLARLI